MSNVPTSNLNALYTNTTPGVTASPGVVDAAIIDIVATVNGNSDIVNGLISSELVSELGIINVKDYNASGLTTTTTGSITTGTALLTVASTTGRAAGQGISIAGAGVAGVTLVTTISAINGTVITLTTNASTTVISATVGFDDTAAIQTAINYCIANNKNLWFEGTFIVSPLLMADGSYVCLYILDNTAAQNYDMNIDFYFCRGSRIKTTSVLDCTLLRMKASNMVITNMMLEGNSTHTILLELSRINKLVNTETDIICYNSFNDMKLISGKTAISIEGSAYYNTFNTLIIQGISGKAIYLRDSAYQLAHSVRESNVNRNQFNNVALLGVGQGVYITYGNTNKFVNLSIEGTTSGIYVTDAIHQANAGMWATEDNMFVNVTMEAVTNEIFNNANGSKFVNISTEYGSTNNTWTIAAQTYIGGLNSTYSLEKVMNMIKVPDSLGKIPYSGMHTRTTYDTSDYGYRALNFSDISISGSTITNYAREFIESLVADSTNITAFLWESYVGNPQYNSWKRVGGIVYVVGKFKCTITTLTDPIKIKIPTKYLPMISYSSFGLVPALRVPIVVYSSGYKESFMTINTDTLEIAPPSGNWTTGALANMVFLNNNFFAEAVFE